MLSGAGQVSHFSFCKVNSGITVFELQSNLPGMRFLMRLIGRRGTWQIMSRGVCAEITSLSFVFFFLSLLQSFSVWASAVQGWMRPFKLIRGFQCKLQQLKGFVWGTSRASLAKLLLAKWKSWRGAPAACLEDDDSMAKTVFAELNLALMPLTYLFNYLFSQRTALNPSIRCHLCLHPRSYSS